MKFRLRSVIGVTEIDTSSCEMVDPTDLLFKGSNVGGRSWFILMLRQTKVKSIHLNSLKQWRPEVKRVYILLRNRTYKSLLEVRDTQRSDFFNNWKKKNNKTKRKDTVFSWYHFQKVILNLEPRTRTQTVQFVYFLDKSWLISIGS